MKPEEVRRHFNELAVKASDVARQLAFAGLGLIWILRNQAIGDPSRGAYQLAPPLLPRGLKPAAVAFIVAFGFDLLQYAIGTLIWGLRTRSEKRAFRASAPGLASPEIVVFILKFLAYGVAYYFLFRFAFKMPARGAYSG